MFKYCIINYSLEILIYWLCYYKTYLSTETASVFIDLPTLHTCSGVSHSAFSNVQKIEQEGTVNNATTRSSTLISSKLDPFFDSSPGSGTNGRISGGSRRMDLDYPFSETFE